MSVMASKLISLFIMLGLSLIIGMIPLKLKNYFTKEDLNDKRKKRRNKIVTCLLCYGAGILLSTVFLHMLPEVREGFELAKLAKEEAEHEALHSSDEHDDHDRDHGHDDHGFPMAEFAICSGFFLIYLIEEVVHKAINGSLNKQEDSPQNKKSENGHLEKKSSVEGKEIPGTDKGKSCGGLENPAFESESVKHHNETVFNMGNPYIEQTCSHGSSDEFHSHIPTNVDKDQSLQEHIRNILVVLALSIHMVFEGLAVGLQERVEDVWYLWAAICAHKFVIIFCVSLELIIGGTSIKLFISYIIVLCVFSPLGIAIGIMVTEFGSLGGSQHLIVVTSMQGVAGGTLLYVAFLEVLERERRKPGNQLLKLLCFALGFSSMAVFEALGGHSHAAPSH